MRRTIGASLAGFAGAFALVLSAAAGAHAQQPQSGAAPLTEVQTAAVKRLQEILDLINSGDYAKTRAYFEANSVDIRTDVPGVTPGEWHRTAFAQTLGRRRNSGGLDLVRVETEPERGDVVGIVRNRVTGDEDYLGVRVEAQPPHRITWLPAMSQQLVASWKLKRAESNAVTEQEKLQEIGDYLKRMGDADIFSGAVVIAKDGKPVFAQGYGYAEREKQIPNTVETPFLMGSITKVFTSLAIGLLVERGKLSYDDPLSKFLPDFPDPESAKKIRVKHLLSHTSGLSREGAPKLDASAMDRQTTVKAMVDVLERKPLEFEPGTKHQYSNVGFLLLGRVIEVASGEDYYDFVQKNVFAPAAVKSAGFPVLPSNGVAVVPMAYPYEIAWDGVNYRLYAESQLGKHGRRGSPAGHSTISALDLLAFSTAMRAGRVVKPETFLLHSTGKPELNSPIYGYGIIGGPYLGRPFVGHNGRAPGQCSEFGELRDTPYTIVVLSNLRMDVCRQVTLRILRVLRPTEATPKPEQPR